MDRRTVDVPAQAGWFMPAEWWPHTRCWMAWPTHHLWGDLLEPAQRQVATVAQAIAEFEPVSLIAPEADAPEAVRACGDSIAVVPLPSNDCWTRDTGPTFLVNAQGEPRI